MEKIELQVKIEPRFPLAPLLLCSVCVGAGPRLIADCARPTGWFVRVDKFCSCRSGSERRSRSTSHATRYVYHRVGERRGSSSPHALAQKAHAVVRVQAYYKFFEQLVAPTEDQLFRRSQKLQPGTLENVFSAISTPPETLPQQKSEEGTDLSHHT